MLNALCALSSIMFGIAELEFSEMSITKNTDILLYANTVFSIILWCNILFKEKLLTDEAIALRQQGLYDQAAKSF